MVLTLYIARYLGLQAAAGYGFVVGASAAMIALTGFGLDQPVNRYLVRASLADSIRRQRDRLILRTAAGVLLTAVVLLALSAADPRSAVLRWTVAVILVAEPIVYDLQQGLVARRRPVAANALLFVRAGAWVAPVVLLGLVDAQRRSLDLVFAGWAAGLIAGGAVVLAVALRDRRLRRALARSIDWAWLRAAPAALPLAYLAELGQAAMIYSDRFLVSALAGLSAAGTFVFLWGFTNAVVPLVQAAVFNHLTPALVAAHAAGDAAWRPILANGLRRTGRLSLALGAAVFVALLVLLPLVRIGHGAVTLGLAALMIVASAIRLQADVLQLALASREDDAGWIRVNLIGLLAGPMIGVVALAAFGLIGAGIQMLATALLALVLRRRRLHRDLP